MDMKKKMDKKKKRKIVLGILVVILGIACFWYVNYQIPKIEATERFNNAVEQVESINSKFQKRIDEAEELVNKGETPYDSAALENLQIALTDAKNVMVEIPEIPSETDEINLAAEKLEQPIDYSKQEDNLTKSTDDFSNSVKQLVQVTHPKESFILERLKGVNSVVKASPVTEDNDPNGNLNKEGGYTSTIYFESSKVDQSKVSGDSLIDRGTEAGGSIETYANADDAKRRNEYLAAFDGGILTSGSHEVVGTVVVRTSNLLKASQQKELTAAIKQSLLRLDQ